MGERSPSGDAHGNGVRDPDRSRIVRGAIEHRPGVQRVPGGHVHQLKGELPHWLVEYVAINLTPHLAEWEELLEPIAALREGIRIHSDDDWVEAGNFVVPRFHTATLLREAIRTSDVAELVSGIRLRREPDDPTDLITFEGLSLSNNAQSVALGGAILGTAAGAGFNGVWLSKRITAAQDAWIEAQAGEREERQREQVLREEEERRELALREEEFHRRLRRETEADDTNA